MKHKILSVTGAFLLVSVIGVTAAHAAMTSASAEVQPVVVHSTTAKVTKTKKVTKTTTAKKVKKAVKKAKKATKASVSTTTTPAITQ